MNFELHQNLANKAFITDLPLCRVLFEDNALYPWIFLVPRRKKISKIMDLTTLDQLILLNELDLAQKVMWQHFKPTQLNVAAIGNKTPQLHIHIIARHADDQAWPDVVWGQAQKQPYNTEEKSNLISSLKKLFSISM